MESQIKFQKAPSQPELSLLIVEYSNSVWTEKSCLRASTIISTRKAIRSAGRTPRERMLKKRNKSLTEDIAPLLPAGVTFEDDAAIMAFGRVWGELIARIPGESWKSSKTAIEAIRNAKIPALLDGIYE